MSKVETSKVIGARIEIEDYRDLVAYCEEHKIKQSDFIRNAVKIQLEALRVFGGIK